jgi:phage shock protein E
MKIQLIGFAILVAFSVLLFLYAKANDKLSPEKALEKVAAGALLLDVRSPEEFSSGHVEGALNIPHDQISARVGELLKYKDKEIVLYCRSGNRSGLAQAELTKDGFKTTYNAGGLSGLQSAGAKVVP